MQVRNSLFTFLLTSALATYAAPIPQAPSISAKGYVLIDASTGKVLSEFNGDELLPPASLTKIMTSYVAAVEIREGRINLADQVPISVKAWRTPGSKTFVREGTSVSLSDLLRGVIIQSGNDASVAVAEYIAGSEEAFAGMMNQHAEDIGMTRTDFRNSTGLPDKEHLTTARDLVTLVRSLISEFPDHYKIYSEREFTYGGIRQNNRNRLLWRDKTVDGVKTGMTKDAGFCLVASAMRGDMRLVSVVMGATDDETRMRETQKLFQWGFRYFETQTLFEPDINLQKVRIYYGEKEELELGIKEKLVLTFPRGSYEDLKSEIDFPRIIEAPIQIDQKIGELRVNLDGQELASVPLIARSEVLEAGFFSRASDAIELFFSDLGE
ncbi:MAG: serine-type D-Ala-D-Ala carboxypeptidase [Gammaproteobacteria bacterium]|nr:serine-type D-Ala-D-Ala carboxypeptidase [Gammaproteobacteria bacterium]